MPFSLDALGWLARSAGHPDQHFNLLPLKGSTSSTLYLIESPAGPSNPWVCSPRVRHRFVLRVLDNFEWSHLEPDLAAHEAAALQEAERAALSAPRLVAYSPADIGFGAPVVLMTFLEGRVELQPPDLSAWLDGLAHQLALIHRHPARDLQWSYRTWVHPESLSPPSWSSIPGAWQRAIDRVNRPPPPFPAVFIHRDYHPTNVLWQAARVSGVVDWINACRGPAGLDVAHCRTNLAKMFGPSTADSFLQSYSAAAAALALPFQYDPYWDLESLLDVCLPHPDYYPPWQHFGFPPISPVDLQHRVDAHLQRVLSRA